MPLLLTNETQPTEGMSPYFYIERLRVPNFFPCTIYFRKTFPFRSKPPRYYFVAIEKQAGNSESCCAEDPRKFGPCEWYGALASCFQPILFTGMEGPL